VPRFWSIISEIEYRSHLTETGHDASVGDLKRKAVPSAYIGSLKWSRPTSIPGFAVMCLLAVDCYAEQVCMVRAHSLALHLKSSVYVVVYVSETVDLVTSVFV